jgi:excisionase family DNA binding protein
MKNRELFYTLPEIADMLKVSRQTVYRWVKSGELPAFKLGHDWRIKDSDLQKFIEERKA